MSAYYYHQHGHGTARRAMLLQAARAWRGTPFYPNSCAIGPSGGVDCVRLQAAIHHRTGFVPRLQLPRSTMDYSAHGRVSELLRWLREEPALQGRLQEIVRPATDDLLTGDLVTLLEDRVEHHLGTLVTGGDIVHCLRPLGVIFTPLGTMSLSRQITRAFRPLEP